MIDLKYSHKKGYLPDQLRILITGAASGIGLAQARMFLELGHIVIGIDINSPPMIYDLIEKYPQNLTFILADITNYDQLEKRIKPKLAKGLDVLCNTAGQLDDYNDIEKTSFELWNQIIQTNLTGAFNVTKICLRFLLDNPSSRIINMSSIAGLEPGGGGIAYTSAKHGLIGFTKQLAHDYSAQGLRVNAIAPGAVITPMNEADFVGSEPLAQWVKEETPVKRWATPNEIAELTKFLTSNEADYIQGAVIPIDGGWLIK